MDVRILGASAAVVACTGAVFAVGYAFVSSPAVQVDRPPDALLISRTDATSESAHLPTPDRLRARTPSSAVPADLGTSRPQSQGTATSAPKATLPPSSATTDVAPARAPPVVSPPTPVRPLEVARVAPPPAAPPPAAVDHRYDGVFTMEQIKRLKTALRLSPDQERLWAPVAGLLRDIGRQQMAQIDAGQKPELNMGMDMMQRFYSAASPLLQTLREDQKAEIRRRATAMGLGAYASYI